MHKLWHQTGVGVVSLTEVVRYHLREEGGRGGVIDTKESDCMQIELSKGFDLVFG